MTRNGRSVGSASFKPRDDRGLVAEIGPMRQHPRRRRRPRARRRRTARRVDRVRRHAPRRRAVDRRPRGRGAIRKAWLDHIALTGDPAYPGAKVLAVRAVDEAGPTPPPVATPNLGQGPGRAARASVTVAPSRRGSRMSCRPDGDVGGELRREIPFGCFTKEVRHARADRCDDRPARSRDRGAQRPHRRVHRRRPGRWPRPQQPGDGDDRRRA